MASFKLQILSVLFLGCVSTSAFAKQVKTDICHVTHKDGVSFQLISIPEAAMLTHREHGDRVAPPEGSTSGIRLDGTIFVVDSECEIVYTVDEAL